MPPCTEKVAIRRLKIGKRCGEIEYSGGEVSRGSGGNWNLRVTFAYVIYW